MQNRTNRSLLFGSRATTGTDTAASTAEADNLELDNQRAVEQLRGSAGTMKDIAIHIDADVADQNRALDRMDKRFDNANSLISKTSNLLQEMVSDRTGSRMCGLVATFLVALVALYYMLKK